MQANIKLAIIQASVTTDTVCNCVRVCVLES